MKAFSVKYRSHNGEDYTERVSARNSKEAEKNAKRAVYRRDDRDVIILVIEDGAVDNWIWV